MKTMMRLFTPLLMLLFGVGVAHAQLTLKPGIGLTYSDFSKDPSTGKFNGKVGYQFGGSILSGKDFYFEGGLFYQRRSVEYQEASTGLTFQDDIDGMRVPVMAGFHLLGGEEGGLAVRAFGGGSVSWITGVNSATISKDELTSPTYGVFAGAGLDIAIIFVDLKYEWSLTDVSNVSTVDVGQSRTFIANAGVRLPL
jgi:hypothetical protein